MIVASPIFGNALLDPLRHIAAVDRFLLHFSVPAGRPSPEYLQRLLAAFSNLPYENLSKIIKFNRWGEDRAARLRLPEEVMEDHVRLRTGGTCFSLTFFLQCILLRQGFPSYIIMGDMKAGRNVHCALIVPWGGIRYLVDPGYALRRPLALDSARPRLYHSDHTGVELRFDALAQCYDLFTFTRTEVKWRYRFADRPTPAGEFWGHWQASFHRNSMHGLCLTQVREQELVFILKDFMRITSPEGKRNVNLKRNLHHAIAEIFGIAPEYVEQALAAVQENMARARRAGG